MHLLCKEIIAKDIKIKAKVDDADIEKLTDDRKKLLGEAVL